MNVRYILILIFTIIPLMATAVEPDEVLADPVLEARARVISKELRCVVCKNQDIDSSNAGVARDLRLLVRERLVEGDTNEEVIAYIVARYGDYVLLKPPFKPSTYILWFMPPILVLLAIGFGTMIILQARNKTVNRSLSNSDEEEVVRILSTIQNGDEK